MLIVENKIEEITMEFEQLKDKKKKKEEETNIWTIWTEATRKGGIK